MKMNDLLNGDPDKNPFKRAETEIVNVEITSILAQSKPPTKLNGMNI